MKAHALLFLSALLMSCSSDVVENIATHTSANDLDAGADGVDTDANERDNGCIVGEARSCGPTTDQGECSFGTETCSDGFWGTCVGGVHPTTEICDGLDNDCDGQTDEAPLECSPPPQPPVDFAATYPKSVLTFMVYGDAHQDNPPKEYNNTLILPRLVKLFNRQKPAFVINTGDNVSEGNDPNDWQMYRDVMSLLSLPLVPGFPAASLGTVGNHEYCRPTSPQYFDIAACHLFRDAFPYMKNLLGRSDATQNFYSFAYGDSYFIVDNRDYTNSEAGTQQHRAWVADVAAHARNSSYSNVFYFNHESPYHTSMKACGAYYEFIRQRVNNLYKENQNLFYFAGHEDGVFSIFDCEAGDGGCKKAKYIIASGAGGRPGTFTPCTSEEYKGDVRVRASVGTHGVVRVAVSGKKLRVTLLDPDGNVVANGGLAHDFYFDNEYYVGDISKASQSNVDLFSCNFNDLCETSLKENELNCPGDCL